MPVLCPHVTPAHQEELPLCAWPEWSWPCLPSPCPANRAFPKPGMQDFQTRDPHLNCESSQNHLKCNRPQAQSQPNSLNEITARDAPVLPCEQGAEQAPNPSGENKISLARLIRISELWCTTLDFIPLIIPYHFIFCNALLSLQSSVFFSQMSKSC